MAVDSGIALQVRPVEIPDQLGQYARLLQLQGLQGQQKVQDLQLRQGESAAAENEALKSTLSGIQPDSEGGYDLKSLAPKLMAASPTQGGALVKNFGDLNKQQAEQRKLQLEGALKQLDFIGQVASGVTDQASYDQAKAFLQQNNIDTASMPPNYDPNAVKMNQMRALSIKDRLTQEHQALTLAETQRHNLTAEGTAAAGLNIQQQNADRAATQADRTNAINEREIAVKEKTAKTTPGATEAKADDEREVNRLLDIASPLLDSSTGSYSGTAIDESLRAFGISTKGASAASKLKAIEGALISKMPKMSGPQSDKDVLLYKQMAGQIGDRTIPAAQKKAAMDTIREINSRYTQPTDKTKTGGTYAVGQIIESNGKKYRVTGGDLNDPDVEEVR